MKNNINQFCRLGLAGVTQSAEEVRGVEPTHCRRAVVEVVLVVAIDHQPGVPATRPHQDTVSSIAMSLTGGKYTWKRFGGRESSNPLNI